MAPLIYNNYKIFHYYLIPLVCAIGWCGMLATMLLVWAYEGRPIYYFMTRIQDPVYISDIGASSLKPLFVICSGFQGIFFVLTLVVDYLLRFNNTLIKDKGKGIIYFNEHQRKIGFASIPFAIIGQLGILFTAIFDAAHHTILHFTMVTIFITAVCIACLLNVLNSLIFGVYVYRSQYNYQTFSNLNGRKHRHSKLNYFFKIVIIKICWMLIGGVLAILFGFYMSQEESSLSAIFEWTVAFWYAILLVIWALDLLPFAYVYNDLEEDTEKILSDSDDDDDDDDVNEAADDQFEYEYPESESDLHSRV